MFVLKGSSWNGFYRVRVWCTLSSCGPATLNDLSSEGFASSKAQALVTRFALSHAPSRDAARTSSRFPNVRCLRDGRRHGRSEGRHVEHALIDPVRISRQVYLFTCGKDHRLHLGR